MGFGEGARVGPGRLSLARIGDFDRGLARVPGMACLPSTLGQQAPTGHRAEAEFPSANCL